MRSLCIRKLIKSDIHELYEIMPGDDCSEYPWLISYLDEPLKKLHIAPKDKVENWFWVPKKIYYSKIANGQ